MLLIYIKDEKSKERDNLICILRENSVSGVTSDWYVTYKFNEILNVDSCRTLGLFRRKMQLQCEVI